MYMIQHVVPNSVSCHDINFGCYTNTLAEGNVAKLARQGNTRTENWQSLGSETPAGMSGIEWCKINPNRFLYQLAETLRFWQGSGIFLHNPASRIYCRYREPLSEIGFGGTTE